MHNPLQKIFLYDFETKLSKRMKVKPCKQTVWKDCVATTSARFHPTAHHGYSYLLPLEILRFQFIKQGYNPCQFLSDLPVTFHYGLIDYSNKRTWICMNILQVELFFLKWSLWYQISFSSWFSLNPILNKNEENINSPTSITKPLKRLFFTYEPDMVYISKAQFKVVTKNWSSN